MEARNQELQAAIDELQSVVSSDDKPYDETTAFDANSAINDGKIAMAKISTWDEQTFTESSDFNFLQTKDIIAETEHIDTLTTDLNDLTSFIAVPDYTDVTGEIKNAQKLLDNVQ